ncbi:MAG TPA: hypothetical protein VFF04_01410 [Candidatus Babeliales bacterium]|nr:hypothetical protein [Candidatus Babeliales bacterium]
MKKIGIFFFWILLGSNALNIIAAETKKVVCNTSCCSYYCCYLCCCECCQCECRCCEDGSFCKEFWRSGNHLKFIAGCCYALENLQEETYRKKELKKYSTFKDPHRHRRTFSGDDKDSASRGQRWLLSKARKKGESDDALVYTPGSGYENLSNFCCCQCFPCCKGKRICTQTFCCGYCNRKKSSQAPEQQEMVLEKRSTMTPELQKQRLQVAAQLALAVQNRSQESSRAARVTTHAADRDASPQIPSFTLSSARTEVSPISGHMGTISPLSSPSQSGPVKRFSVHLSPPSAHSGSALVAPLIAAKDVLPGSIVE